MSLFGWLLVYCFVIAEALLRCFDGLSSFLVTELILFDLSILSTARLCIFRGILPSSFYQSSSSSSISPYTSSMKIEALEKCALKASVASKVKSPAERGRGPSGNGKSID